MSRSAPIIEYAHKIGKNTAEFSVNDLAAFMKWWMKQPVRKDIMEATPEQRKVYEEDCKKVQTYFKEQRMSKNGQYTNAMKSRLNSDQVVDMNEVEMQEEPVVAELGLTQTDIDALKIALSTVLNEFDLSESPDVEASLKGIYEVIGGGEE